MGDIFGLVIVRPFGLIVMAIYNAVNSFGLAIILFALLIKLVLVPLAIKSKRSMMAMSAMNAEMQEVQKKYANNRVKMNEEMQKLYEKHGVNPMSGCLPQFIQLPIMMGLFYVVQQPIKFMMGFGDEAIAALASKVGVDMATAGYYGQIALAEKLNQFVDAAGNFTQEILQVAGNGGTLVPLDFNFFGLNMAQTPSIKQISIIWLIPILSGATAYLSSFVMQKMQGTSNTAQGSMKTMLLIMPLMSVYFGFILPGAVGLYWIFNNIIMMVQEILLSKYFNAKKKKEDELSLAEHEREKELKKQRQREINAENNTKKKGD